MSIRYIFHGGTRDKNSNGTTRQKGIAHNSAFYLAAKNVANDYKSQEGIVKLIKISTAAALVNEINSNKENSITSLDILCHGTPYSLNFSIKENENCGLITGSIAKAMLKIYYSSWEDGIYDFSARSHFVSDLDFTKFSSDARVQIHGCNTARGTMIGDTLTESFSKELKSAGKNQAYVIGHMKKSNPLINGSQTTIKAQDYRHGKRAIIVNGDIIKETNQKGLIKHSDILSLIKEK